MRIVIQRVSEAKVSIRGKISGSIGMGLVVFAGIEKDDTPEDTEYLARKLVNLRIFENNEGKMYYSILDKHGEILVVSQFTLSGDCRKGNRPSFDTAASPDYAKEMYQVFVSQLENAGIKTAQGVFGEKMEVSLVNSGPVTILIDSKKRF